MRIEAITIRFFMIVGLCFVLGLVTGCELADLIETTGESGDTEETAEEEKADAKPQPQPAATERLLGFMEFDALEGPYEGKWLADGKVTALVFYVGHATSPNSPVTHPIFDRISVDESDVGRTFTIASAADDPDFPDFVARLTNGDNEWFSTGQIFVPYDDVYTGASREDDLFGPSPDCHGNHITRITLTLDQFSMRYEYEMGVEGMQWFTYYSFYSILRFYGKSLAP